MQSFSADFNFRVWRGRPHRAEKQYKVAKDTVLRVESLSGDVGSKLTLGEVLLVGGDAPRSARRWSRAPR